MGFKYLARGFSLMLKPGIRPWVILPLLLNILLFIGLTGLAVSYFGGWLDALMAWLPGWLDFIATIIWGLFALALLLVYAYTFTLAANLISSPFFGVLAERCQHHLGQNLIVEDISWRNVQAIAWRSFLRELRKLLYFLPRSAGVLLLCLALSFVPLVNFLTPVLLFLWGAWSMALQYLDYPADVNHRGFDELRKRASRRRTQALGFGGLVLGGTAIPLFNLLVLPAAVCGATAMWLEEFAAEQYLVD